MSSKQVKPNLNLSHEIYDRENSIYEESERKVRDFSVGCKENMLPTWFGEIIFIHPNTDSASSGSSGDGLFII